MTSDNQCISNVKCKNLSALTHDFDICAAINLFTSDNAIYIARVFASDIFLFGVVLFGFRSHPLECSFCRLILLCGSSGYTVRMLTA